MIRPMIRRNNILNNFFIALQFRRILFPINANFIGDGQYTVQNYDFVNAKRGILAV